MTKKGTSGAFAPFPFDKAQDLRATFINESLVTAAAASDISSAENLGASQAYAIRVGAGSSTVTVVDPTPNHQGVISLNSIGTTAGMGVALTLGPPANVPLAIDDNGIVGAALLRTTSALSALELFVGFRQAAVVRPAASVDGDFGYLYIGNSTPANIVSLAVSNEGAADEEVEVDVGPTLNAWTLVEVYADTSGGFVRVTNANNIARVARLNTVPDPTDQYQFCVVAGTSGTTASTVQVDTLQVRSLAGRTSSADGAVA